MLRSYWLITAAAIPGSVIRRRRGGREREREREVDAPLPREERKKEKAPNSFSSAPFLLFSPTRLRPMGSGSLSRSLSVSLRPAFFLCLLLLPPSLCLRSSCKGQIARQEPVQCPCILSRIDAHFLCKGILAMHIPVLPVFSEELDRLLIWRRRPADTAEKSSSPF